MNWPTDPMRQNDRLIAAVCDDLFDMVVNKSKGTPRADAVCEVNRQINRQPRCDGCGHFIAYAGIESNAARNEFTPLNEFGPEESAWVCPRCIVKERNQ